MAALCSSHCLFYIVSWYYNKWTAGVKIVQIWLFWVHAPTLSSSQHSDTLVNEGDILIVRSKEFFFNFLCFLKYVHRTTKLHGLYFRNEFIYKAGMQICGWV